MTKRSLILASAAAALGVIIGWQTLAKLLAGDPDITALANAMDAGPPPPIKPAGPYACASLVAAPALGSAPALSSALAESGPLSTAPAGLARWEHRDSTLRARGPLDKLTIGVVADAHGNPEHLPAIREHFLADQVDLVFALGGMATHQGELEAMLATLAEPAHWLVIAVPGDWEAIPTHRGAVQSLAERGVVDGSQVRRIDAGSVRLVTLPGAPHVERLLAGEEGCVHAPEDMAALAQLFAGGPEMRVLLSQVPPRQQGPAATDLGAEGVHIGELALAEVMRAAEVDVVIHSLAPTAPLSGGSENQAELDDTPLVLSAGAAGGHPVPHLARRPHLALIATLESNRIAWSTVK